jgi:membrane dipeptidase
LSSGGLRSSRFDDALALHRQVPVIDGHADSILDVQEGRRRLTERSAIGHLDFPRAREAGVACTVQTAWPRPQDYPVAARRVLTLLERLLEELEAARGSAALVTGAAEIRTCHAQGHLGVLLNIEGAEALHGEVALLRVFYRLGVRMMQLVWDHRNEAADGSLEAGSRGGLTRFGRDLVGEMNRLGMVIDLSHLTPAGFYDVLEYSSHPVVFSHGNCAALFPHRRNLTDDQIRALAAKGGVFGISAVSSFMGEGAVSFQTMADHIDHAVQLVGFAHVGLGSDFDGCTPPADLPDVAHLPVLTAELMERGYGTEDLAMILGGNYLRVFDAVFGR